MPATFEKKVHSLAVKVPASLLAELEGISQGEDRPLGYIVRELMVRGLNLYRSDGRLRDPILDTGSNHKVRKLEHLGEVGDGIKMEPKRKKA